MARPQNYLENGETLLFSDDELRDLPKWIAIFFIALPPPIYLAGWILAPRYFGEPWNVAIAAGSYLLWIIGPEIFLAAGWLNRWRIAVTDRRILFRSGILGLRCNGVALPNGRPAGHEWRDGRLSLTFDDEALAVRCNVTVAAKVIEAVAKARRG